MCLSTAYYDKDGERTVIADRISRIEIEGESIILTDFMGRKTEALGTVKSVDLENNSIIIEIN